MMRWRNTHRSERYNLASRKRLCEGNRRGTAVESRRLAQGGSVWAGTAPLTGARTTSQLRIAPEPWLQSSQINSKWTKNLNLRPETLKLPEGDIGKITSRHGHKQGTSGESLKNTGNTPKNRQIREAKKLLHMVRITLVRRQPRNVRNIFVNCMSDTTSICKIYKEPQKLNDLNQLSNQQRE